MKKIKVMSIFGTRPEAIKMAPVVLELQKQDNIDSVVCVTAQHREMLDQVLEVFNITPDHDLDIMQQRQTLTGITVRALEGLEKVMQEEKPDMVLVHGDTTTTFAGGLAAFYNHVQVGHVEAGLRTYNKYEPYPEEINRQLTGRLADLHFSPTDLSRNNLLKEVISEDVISVTGNTAIDAIRSTVKDNYKFRVNLLNELDYDNKRIIAMTAHRRENLGEPLENICKAVHQLVEDYEDMEVVYAVHLNPAVQEVAHKYLGDHPRVHLIEPLNMDDMHNLLSRSHLVLTDSGGLQEEVPAFNKPVVVLRNITERPEGVAAGTLKLAGTEQEDILRITREILENAEVYDKMANAKNPYGDGLASKRIVSAIQKHFGLEGLDIKPFQ